MLRIVERIKRGEGRREDLDILVQVANSMGIMPGTTICGLADGAGWPVKNAITKFRAEFEAAVNRSNAERDERAA
jgi:NADH-quinone oxidoreductase subunit F